MSGRRAVAGPVLARRRVEGPPRLLLEGEVFTVEKHERRDEERKSERDSSSNVPSSVRNSNY